MADPRPLSEREGELIDCMFPAAALTKFERPVGRVQSYVVTCQCGWESQHTTDWVRSLDRHMERERKKRGL